MQSCRWALSKWVIPHMANKKEAFRILIADRSTVMTFCSAVTCLGHIHSKNLQEKNQASRRKLAVYTNGITQRKRLDNKTRISEMNSVVAFCKTQSHPMHTLDRRFFSVSSTNPHDIPNISRTSLGDSTTSGIQIKVGGFYMSLSNIVLLPRSLLTCNFVGSNASGGFARSSNGSRYLFCNMETIFRKSRESLAECNCCTGCKCLNFVY